MRKRSSPKPDLISRRKAIELGQSKYFTGRPCTRGHTAERYCISATCTQCAREDAMARSRAIRENREKRHQDAQP